MDRLAHLVLVDLDSEVPHVVRDAVDGLSDNVARRRLKGCGSLRSRSVCPAFSTCRFARYTALSGMPGSLAIAPLAQTRRQ